MNTLETFIENSKPTFLGEAYEIPAVLVHKDMEIKKLESLLNAPKRISCKFELSDMRGFIDYVNDFKSEGTAIFAGKEKITCIFDYHKKDAPAWGDHVATYNLAINKRWRDWFGKNNTWLSQRDFCDFLESGVNEIVVPTQAEVLDLAKNFRATAKLEVVSDINSNIISYNKETKGAHARTEVTLPEFIEVAVSPFDGLSAINEKLSKEEQFGLYQLKARLAFSLARETEVHFKYVLLGADRALDETMETLRQAIIKLTNVKVYIG